MRKSSMNGIRKHEGPEEIQTTWETFRRQRFCQNEEFTNFVLIHSAMLRVNSVRPSIMNRDCLRKFNAPNYTTPRE